MRLYTHTHTGVLENRKNEKQKEAENINAVENLWKESESAANSTATSTNYVNNTKPQENSISSSIGAEENNKKEQNNRKNKNRIKSKEGKLQKVSCLLVMRKIIVIMIIILVVILASFGIKYNWQIKNIIEKIGKVMNISGTNANIEEVAAMDMTKVDLIADAKGVKIPVPKGYVLSGASDENDVTTGVVIYEGTAAVTDANVATAKTTRNQWVWVPVSAANVSRIYSEDAYGRKSGKLYEYSKNGRTENLEGGFEPGILTDRDNEKYFQQYNLYGYTMEKLYEETQKNYEETIESIKTYGGFYIGRYETGDLSQRKPMCVQYNNDIANQTWYTMYNKAQHLGANSNVKSMMIYESLWDEVLMWLIESNAKSYEEIGYRSLDWGNFYGASFTYYATVEATSTSTKDHGMGIVLPTGARAGSDADNWKRNCANNIYDLAGNTMEFTQEASDMSTRSTLGSVCLFRDVFYPMAERYSQSPEETDNAVSCRMHLIIS